MRRAAALIEKYGAIQFCGISEAKMIDYITRLGRDVQIVIGPEHRTGQAGRVAVVHA